MSFDTTCLNNLHGRTALVAAALTLTAACSAGPVSVERVDPATAYRGISANALSTGEISMMTRNTLRRHDLLTKYKKDPEAAIADLHSQMLLGDPTHEQLATLGETSFSYGMATGDRAYLLSSAVYAYTLLFPETHENDLNVVDPRVRVAIDLYNTSLARAFISEDGESVDLRAGTFDLPFGTIEIAFDESALTWSGTQLSDFIPATELEVEGLTNRYRRWGIGAPLAARAIRSGDSPEKAGYLPPAVRVPVTALLRIDNPRAQLGQSELTGQMELYTPTDSEEVSIGSLTLPLETEPTAALAVGLAEANPWRQELRRFMGAMVNSSSTDVRMSALEPAKPDSIPVVFVHGTYSSSARWANMVNDLLAYQEIRDRFDFYFFSYESGNPIVFSGSQLRGRLDELHERLLAEGMGDCSNHMVVIGHSQGGMLTKMTAIDSGDTFWGAVSRKPFDKVKISSKNRELIREAMFFDARPYVDRVVFIATPHRGSYLAASGFARRLAQRLIAIPADLASLSADMLQLREDPDTMLNMERVSTSIDNMSPGSTAVKTLSSVPIKEGIAAHSIIPVKNEGPLEDGVDGVVAYKSAHIEPVDSELVVRSGHSCQDNPHTINEVLRILKLHAAATQCGSYAPVSAGF